MLQKIFWNNENQLPYLMTLDSVYALLQNDDMQHGLMYESMQLDDVLENVTFLDAVVIQKSQIDIKMRQMMLAMKRVATHLDVVKYTITDPFTRLGVANIAAIFELSDGQSISIFFHNPDTTPKKITATDLLISYKWALNKKDITIVVAPERGQEIDIRQVAMRIMKLAEKNSEIFVRRNQNITERRERIQKLRDELPAKQAKLDQLLAEIKELEAQKSDQAVDQLLAEEDARNRELRLKKINVKFAEADFDLLEGNFTPSFDNLNALQAWLQKVYPMSDLNEGGYRKTDIDVVYGTRKGQDEVFSDRIDVGLSAGDFNPHSQHIADYMKARFQQLNINVGEITAITPVTAEPESQPPLVQEAEQGQSEIPEPTEPIVVQGNEFGEFDTSTAEGKKALREKAFEYLKNLAKQGESVFCPALNADVHFSVVAAKKYKKFNTPEKAKLALKIKEIIASGRIFKASAETYDDSEHKMIYHYLKTPVQIGQNQYGVRIVIREDHNGAFHYDLQVKESVDMILDNTEKATVPFLFHQLGGDGNLSTNGITDLPLSEYGDSNTTKETATLDTVLTLPEHNSGGITNKVATENDPTLFLDDGQEKYVLNLFLYDENGNPIPDEEEFEEEETNQNEPDKSEKPEEKHYSELVNDVLVSKYGWRIENGYLKKETPNPNYDPDDVLSIRVPFITQAAKWLEEDRHPKRWLQFFNGVDLVFEMDGRESIDNAEQFAQRFNESVNLYLKTGQKNQVVEAQSIPEPADEPAYPVEFLEDKQFLQNVIDGKEDVLADELYDKLLEVATRQAGNSEMTDLIKQAIDSYQSQLDTFAQQPKGE